MVHFTVRCHPYRDTRDDVHQWLDRRAASIRSVSREGRVTLSRLCGGDSATSQTSGWLVEITAAESDRLLVGAHLVEILREMTEVGLRGTVLTPLPSSDWTARAGAFVPVPEPAGTRGAT